MGTAELVLVVVAVYAAIGAVFGIVFVTAGVAKVDHAAQGAPLGFRVLIWPGVAALWPLMLVKWASAVRAREEDKR